MTSPPGLTIWELVRQAAQTLPEPFSRATLISWVSKRRPDVEISSISTHIQYATAETPNRASHNLGTREPLLTRVDRGLYRRYGGGTAAVRPADEGDDAARGFERRVRRDLAAIIQAGYRPTMFQRMLAESGAVGTARRLLAASILSDGFRYLWEHRLLRHSIENAVLAEEFAELFTDQEKDVARQRLTDAGYR